MRISESIERFGYFWLPTKPDDRLVGILRVTTTSEINLEVVGFFGDIEAAWSDSAPEIGRIVGVIDGGDLVTLDRCFYTKRNLSLGGISKSTIHANFLLRGAQYDEGESITFSRFKFSVEGLDEWLSMSGLRVEHNWSERSASILFQPPKERFFRHLCG